MAENSTKYINHWNLQNKPGHHCPKLGLLFFSI